MKLRLAWTKTGDYFDIVSTHPELAEWYATKCKHYNSNFKTNVFSQDPDPQNINATVEKIKNDLVQVNDILKKLRIETIDIPNNFFDQRDLNQLHRHWIHIDQNKPGLDNLLYRIDPKLFDAYNSLNMETHKLESSFNYVLRAVDHWKDPNPFTDHCFVPGIFNVSICYTDHGRNSWEKFINYESKPNDHELSNWQNIGSAISINLIKPYVSEFPKEFLKYCVEHTIKPVYSCIALGNLPDVESLARAREIMNNNLTQQDNYLIITHK